MPRSDTDLSMPGCLYPSKPKYTVTSCPIHASGICSAIDSPLYACSAILPDRGRKPLEAILAALGSRSMHDPASGLRRIYLLRTRVNKGKKRKGRGEMPQPFRHLRKATNRSGSAGGISVVVGPVLVVGSVLVCLLADDVVVAIEMHLELAAVLAGDLDLECAGTIPVISLDLADGSAAHCRNRRALRLLGFGTRELLLGVASVGVGDPSTAEG